MDDDELIAAMAGGDDTALRELFARHAPWLAARLMYVEDRTVTEVAGRTGVPEGTVKSRAHRVRQLMRAVLRQPVRDGGGR